MALEEVPVPEALRPPAHHQPQHFVVVDIVDVVAHLGTWHEGFFLLAREGFLEAVEFADQIGRQMVVVGLVDGSICWNTLWLRCDLVGLIS